ncbi:hypothetical protein L210DRAFT_3142981 [Boletus edulis BED1]|uniref:Uncharacterized protein n=1 Tax=Boletus edulis BED1 TaxID=1328754 RepID=A0AAD4GGL6_BOLED|nr:hypothetical protein L210DRAFT_3142981 [Boletus edulis BED1]
MCVLFIHADQIRSDQVSYLVMQFAREENTPEYVHIYMILLLLGNAALEGRLRNTIDYEDPTFGVLSGAFCALLKKKISCINSIIVCPFQIMTSRTLGSSPDERSTWPTASIYGYLTEKLSKHLFQ